MVTLQNVYDDRQSTSLVRYSQNVVSVTTSADQSDQFHPQTLYCTMGTELYSVPRNAQTGGRSVSVKVTSTHLFEHVPTHTNRADIRAQTQWLKINDLSSPDTLHNLFISRQRHVWANAPMYLAVPCNQPGDWRYKIYNIPQCFALHRSGVKESADVYPHATFCGSAFTDLCGVVVFCWNASTDIRHAIIDVYEWIFKWTKFFIDIYADTFLLATRKENRCRHTLLN